MYHAWLQPLASVGCILPQCQSLIPAAQKIMKPSLKNGKVFQQAAWRFVGPKKNKHWCCWISWYFCHEFLEDLPHINLPVALAVVARRRSEGSCTSSAKYWTSAPRSPQKRWLNHGKLWWIRYFWLVNGLMNMDESGFMVGADGWYLWLKKCAWWPTILGNWEMWWNNLTIQ